MNVMFNKKCLDKTCNVLNDAMFRSKANNRFNFYKIQGHFLFMIDKSNQFI